MPHVSRRKFLALSAVSTGSLLLYQCARPTGQVASSVGYSPVIASQGGLLEVNLAATRGTVTVGGREIELMSYNGQIPGPRLEASPGDTVKLRLNNQLGEPTNLHFHGLHVSPSGHADNIFLNIPTGEMVSYEFTIPEDHPGGTFYYHPHRHGLVGRQVFAGLGGIFVVRGALDQRPEIQAAKEIFVFLKDIDPSNPLGQAHPMQAMLGREGDLITVNGQQTPTFTLEAGGLLRLRLVNASAARFYRLSLDDHPMYLIATDGGAIAAPQELSELLLAPGERAEVLVKGDRPAGTYRLMNLPYNRGSMGMMGRGGMGGMGRRGQRGQTSPATAQPLANLTYSSSSGGESTAAALPQQLVPIAALPAPQHTREFRLHHGMAPGQGMVFLINGRTYHHDQIDTQVRLNTTEDWDLVNTDPMDHPFHVHTNPFQVIHHNGQPAPYLAWKDTVLVPAGETVRIRTRFNTFTGKSLYHCHILDHEDRGMAGILAIQA